MYRPRNPVAPVTAMCIMNIVMTETEIFTTRRRFTLGDKIVDCFYNGLVEFNKATIELKYQTPEKRP